MERQRVVSLRFGQQSAGTGYLITTRHVLTARHLVEPEGVGTECAVRPLVGARTSPMALGQQRQPAVLRGEVVWLPRRRNVDLAVVRLKDGPVMKLAVAPVAFGLVPDDEPLPRLSLGIGFPEASGTGDRTIEMKLTWLHTQKLFNLDVESALPRDWGKWAGFSGTAIFCAGLLVGVVNTVDSAWNGLLTATPVERLLEDKRFQAFWTKEKLPAPDKREVTRAAMMKYYAIRDARIRTIGKSVDNGLRTAASGSVDPNQALLAELKAASLKIAPSRPSISGSRAAASLSIDEIYSQANTLQYDAQKWVTPFGAQTASRRLAQGRRLLAAGLKRDSGNAKLLVSMGYIEKTQAQVSQVLGKEDEAARLLGKAATYFAKAYESDPSDVSTLNGMANIFLFAHDYDRAIELGRMIVASQPEYGAAAFDLTLAVEGKLKEVGRDPALVDALIGLYRYLEHLMPQQPEVFPASYLAHVQRRVQELSQLAPNQP